MASKNVSTGMPFSNWMFLKTSSVIGTRSCVFCAGAAAWPASMAAPSRHTTPIAVAPRNSRLDPAVISSSPRLMCGRSAEHIVDQLPHGDPWLCTQVDGEGRQIETVDLHGPPFAGGDGFRCGCRSRADEFPRAHRLGAGLRGNRREKFREAERRAAQDVLSSALLHDLTILG